MKNFVYRVETISELNEIAGFDKPRHPLITVIDYSKINIENAPSSGSFVCSFYAVNFKKHCEFMYGRQFFDHKEGTLHCTAPGQIISFNRGKERTGSEGWGLYFHPELIINTHPGKKLNEYSFFLYSENEALHLSDREKQTLLSVLRLIENECNTNIDKYSQDLLISNLEVFLSYCNRFYGRQFITRSGQNKDIIAAFETMLTDYFNSDKLITLGIPTVKYCADKMNLSPNYFSDLLKSETGKNTREHIQFHLLEKAKNILASSSKTVNEIAYELGFQYPQNFSKLFKKKTGSSPTEFRNLAIKN